MKLKTLIVPLFVAGLLSAQPAVTPHHRQAGRMQQMSAALNLTADQQAQAKAIFQDARKQTQALGPQLKQEHQALAVAMKSDNETQIDQIVQQNAQLDAQVRAIHAKARAKFYSMLTPDQKAKADQMHAKRG